VNGGLQLQDISIQVGEFALHIDMLHFPGRAYSMLVGHTGAGKSLLIKAICGLQALQHGKVRLDDTELTALPPHRRRIGYVPQHGALLPHLDVAANIGFALDLLDWKAADIGPVVARIAKQIGITPLLARNTRSLSGGERQKVALARALVRQPRLLILDEPLCAVDETMREELCQLLQKLHKQGHLTTIHICHSQAETEQLGEYLVRLEGGKVVHAKAMETAA
jgi:ABC-type sugar transport system ATPase subunit